MKKNELYILQIESLNSDMIQIVKEEYLENLIKNINININTLSTRDFIEHLKEIKSLKKFINGSDQIKAEFIMSWISLEMMEYEIMIEDMTLGELELFDLSSLQIKSKKGGK